MRRMGQKKYVFEKQSGEVAEKKGSALKNKPERTGKQSWEVVENTHLWKKQTENEPKTKLPMLLKIKHGEKRTEKQTGEMSAASM